MPPRTRSSGTEVLVVGGGPAGASIGWHLARAGADVLIVDRARFPRAKPCAEYVSPEGSRILEAMGALDILERRAAGLTGMVVHAPSGERIHGEFVARHGFRGFRDRGLGVRREILDTVLLARARAAGADVLEGAKVEGLLEDGGRTVGVRVREAGTVREIRARVVVGADGLRSTIAHRLGLAHRARWPRRIAFVTHYEGVAGIGSLGEMHVRDDGYVGLADVGEGRTNVALVVPSDQASEAAGDAAGFLTGWIARDQRLAERFAPATRVSPVRVTGPFASRARRAGAPGALLVGDAADFYDPFTGEGIYAALRGGEIAAPFAHEMARGAAWGARRDRSIIAAYTAARHDAFAGKWRVERLIGLAVGSPMLMNHAARVLGRDRDLADLLVGVTGDFVPPSAVLSPRALWRFLRPRDVAREPSPAVLHAHRR